MLVYFTFVTLINNKLMKKKLIYLMFLAFGMTILPLMHRQTIMHRNKLCKKGFYVLEKDKEAGCYCG